MLQGGKSRVVWKERDIVLGLNLRAMSAKAYGDHGYFTCLGRPSCKNTSSAATRLRKF